MATRKNLRRELLVWGYIRNIEKQCKQMNIPLEINDIIYLYQRICNKWDQKYSSKNITIDEDQSMITVNGDLYPTVYGSNVVSEGVFVWKIKIVALKKAISLNSPPFVGITEDIDAHLNKYSDGAAWCKKGYQFCGGTGSLYAQDAGSVFGRNKVGTLQGRWNNDGDILQITLNLDDRTLSFEINDKDFGVAFANIKVTKYRLAISFSQNRHSKLAFVE